jgi:predicted DsbA family dithiol-disulfide isomerase/ribosomal protein S17E
MTKSNRIAALLLTPAVVSLPLLSLSWIAGCKDGTASNPTAQATPASSASASTGAATASADQVVAVVGARKITVAELDASIKPELTRLEMEKYQARKAKVDELVQRALVEEEAKAKGVSPDELMTREVASHATEPTDQEIKEFWDKYKEQIKGKFEEQKDRVKQYLKTRSLGTRQGEYLAELRKNAKVEVYLEPPRLEVATTGGIEKGEKSAPITFIEFSDYQCPFCGRSQDVVKQVVAKYGDKLYHVFMDFPLTSIHPLAMPAAAASRCAGDQGKYWEYHDLLFQRQAQLSAENFGKWAQELGMDGAKFAACIKEDKHQKDIQSSMEIGQKAGVTGTPAFFLNGIMISGAQPFEQFESIIQTELERKKS